MRIEKTDPHVANSVKSYRDIGYTFEIAIADIIDNSISAKSSSISIIAAESPKMFVGILDNGIGMNDDELKEAMRLSTKDPDMQRDEDDLGKFGLGLKTASFSHCKKLTVASKSKNNKIYVKQWDIDKIIKTNSWDLNILDESDVSKLIIEADCSDLFDQLNSQDSGTLVLWQKIDRIENNSLFDNIDNLIEHISLVFHRFIGGLKGCNKVEIKINNRIIEAFNPFFGSELQEPYPIKNYNDKIKIQPHIMQSYKEAKTNPEKYRHLASAQGYSQTQGFYLFRSNRLISYATWWRIIPRQDSNQLVRIEIDISNDQDKFWGITITKSGFAVSPPAGIRNELRTLANEITRRGRGAQGGRRRITNRVQTKFWNIARDADKQTNFVINKEHPLLDELKLELSNEGSSILNVYLNSLEAFLPIEDIHREKVHHPDKLKQTISLDKADLKDLVDKMLDKGLDKDAITRFISSEGFDKEMFTDE